MSISAVSSSAGSSYSTVSSTDDTTQLEKQKTNLQQELRKVNQSKEDTKTKEQKAKRIQTEIQLIDAQIQQKKSGSGSTVPKEANPSSEVAVVNQSANSSDLPKETASSNNIDVQI